MFRGAERLLHEVMPMSAQSVLRLFEAVLDAFATCAPPYGPWPCVVWADAADLHGAAEVRAEPRSTSDADGAKPTK